MCASHNSSYLKHVPLVEIWSHGHLQPPEGSGKQYNLQVRPGDQVELIIIRFLLGSYKVLPGNGIMRLRKQDEKQDTRNNIFK